MYLRFDDVSVGLPYCVSAAKSHLSDLMSGVSALEQMDIHVPLQPFTHQVGGHNSMHLLDDRNVCKSLIPRELCFYQDMPAALLEFTPKCKGINDLIKGGCVYSVRSHMCALF